MANAVYNKYMEAVIQNAAGSSLAGSGTTGVYAALVDLADYTFSQSHQYYSDIAAAVVGTPQELTNKTFAGGLFDADNNTIPAVSGDQSEAVVLYVRNAGANTTWRLVAFFDSGITGAPVTPNGGDINVNYNASGIIQF